MIFTTPQYEQFLSMPCKDVDPTDPELLGILSEMKFTATSIGIGLAANQIGHKLNIAIMQLDYLDTKQGDPNYFVDCIMPEFRPIGDNIVLSTEGCLSIPEKTFVLPRYTNVLLTYYDTSGEMNQRSLSGTAACVVQHEVDHLNGILVSHKGKPIVPAQQIAQDT